MGKRMISLLLALFMVVGMIPASVMGVFATETETAANIYDAAVASAVTVDGKLDELDWRTSGKLSGGQAFDILWDGDNLYFAVVAGETDTSLTVKIGEKTLVTAEKAEGAAAIEVKAANSNYGIEVLENVTLIVGESTWTGNVRLNAVARIYKPDLTALSYGVQYYDKTTPDGNLTYTVDGDSLTMANEYMEGKKNHKNGRVYGMQIGSWTLAEDQTDDIVLEFDFVADKLPAYTNTSNIGIMYPVYGFNVMMGDSNKDGIHVGIMEASEDGKLYLCAAYLTAENTKKNQYLCLDKVEDDLFTIRLVWSAEHDLSVYVDGVLKGTLEGVRHYDVLGKSTFGFNLWSSGTVLAEDGSMDVKWTVSNVRVSKPVEVEYTTGIAGFDGKMTALFANKQPTADAAGWDDAGWETFANGEGAVSALIYQQNVYLNILDAGTGTVTATLGEETETAELVDGAALLCFDATKVTAYGEKLSLELKIGETSVWKETGELTVGQATASATSTIPGTPATIKYATTTENSVTFTTTDDKPVYDAKNCAYWIENNKNGIIQASYDPNRDNLFEQTLKIDEMSHGDKTGSFELGTPHLGCGYTILFEMPSIVESGKYDFFTCLIYPDENDKLMLRAVNSEGGAGEEVTLNKSIGEEFRLGLKYGIDNAMTVYVDGEEIAVLENIRYTRDKLYGTHTILLKYLDPITQTAGNGAKFTVSDMTMTAMGTKALCDLEDEITPTAIFGDLDLKAVKQNLPLVTSFQSAYLGVKTLRWTSSNESVVETNGNIHADMIKDQSATLSVYLGDSEKALWSVEVTVPASSASLTALLSESAVTVDGNLIEDSWIGWKKFTNPAGNMAALWTKGWLFLGVHSAEGETLKLEINGKTATVDLVNVKVDGYANAKIAKNAKTGEIEIGIPLSDIDFNLTDYNQAVLFKAELVKGDAVSELDAKLLNFSGDVAELQPLSSYTKDNGPWTLLTNSLSYNGTPPGKVNYAYKVNNNIDHSELVILSNEFQFDALPITTGAMINAAAQADGFYYYFGDEDSSSRKGTTICAAIFTEDGTNLKLRIGQGKDLEGYVFDLGKTLGEKFRITYYWYPNNDLDIYVDGVLLGTVKEAGYATSYLGIDVITYRYYSAKVGTEKVKFTISNLNKIVSKYETVLDELTQNAVFGRIDLEHVQKDLPLVTTFSSANFEALTLKWTTSDPSVVAADGTITRHATEEKTAKLTVFFVGEEGEVELWSVNVTVDPMSVTMQEAPAIIHTGFAAPGSIVLDGVLDAEESWLLNGWVLDSDDQLVGYFSAQYNQEYVFVALDAGDAETVKLTLGDKSITVDMANEKLTGVEGTIAVNGSVAEIQIPVSELLGTEKLEETGFELEIVVTMDSSVYEGTLNATNVDWWATDNIYAGLPMLSNNVKSVAYGGSNKEGGATKPDGNQGAKQLENGWRLYDLYNAEGTNPSGVRTYVLFMKQPVYENFADRSEATHIEFDFEAKALPEWEWDEGIKNSILRAFANYGVTFSLSDKADSSKNSNVAVFGIVNTKDGLYFVINRGAEDYVGYPLNKKVGEQFRLGLTWETSADMVLYIDGEEYMTIPGLSRWVNAVGDTSFVMNMIRNKTNPTSSADDMDVYITNIAFGKAHSTENIIRNLTFDDIRGENEAEDDIQSDLILPTYMTNGQLDHQYPIVWTSSDEATIDPETGKVTRPATGVKAVTLTATLDNKGTAEMKQFSLLVLGETVSNGNTLVIMEDTTPFNKGAYPYEGLLFNLDKTNNSVVYAFAEDAESTKVNLVTLTDLDGVARLNRESLRLFVSDDNATYTEIEEYKLHHDGCNWYLYDFEADARYIKVHYTHRDYEDSNFYNVPGEMIHVSWNESLVIPENATEIDAPTTTLRDQAVAITLPEGIKTEGLRVALNGEILFHYVDKDGTVYVRIADPTTAKLQLWNAEGIDLADKENVYEVTYGTRETLPTGGRWVLTVKAGQTFPDGSVAEVDTIYTMGSKTVKASTDGGYTWTTVGAVEHNEALSSGGWGIDSKTGRLFHEFYGPVTFNGTDITQSNLITYVFYSDDGGKTWTKASGLGKIEGDLQSNYVLSYSDIVELRDNDGTGPNVDFVFNMGAQYNNNGAFCGRVAYTVDGGKTWAYSDSKITYGNETAFEGGVSEGTILEREDGTLVYYARCQSSGVDNFALSYSLDHGVTWLTPGVTSSIYTTNTQALMMTYDFDGFDGDKLTGSPIFMWGGNNVLGGNSYIRNPLNFAVSTNEMDTFRNIQNIFAETFMEEYKTTHYITNPSIQQLNGDDMYITFSRLKHSDSIYMVVNNFTDWFTRTKGAYDSFEHGTVQYEGWITVKGGAEATIAKSSVGNYAMLVKENSQITRSVPYLQNGKLSVDLYVDANTKFVFELQPAFSNVEKKCAVISASVTGTTMKLHDGTVLTLTEGWNTVTFDLELTEYKASVSVNGGNAVAVEVNEQFNGVNAHELGNYITYVTILSSSNVYVDELLVESALDAVTEATEAEKTAAAEVVDMIKALGEITLDDEDAIAAARAAYEALSQAAKDLVDMNVPTGTTTDVNAEDALINYYDVLVAAEAQLSDLKACIKQISVSLEGNIETNYYAVLSDEVANDPNTYMEFTKPDGEVIKISISEATKKGDSYVFTLALAAKEMTDEVKAKVVYTDGESVEKVFSVKAYGDYVLSLESSSAELKSLVTAMLHYGAYAQIHFNYNTDNLANADLGEYDLSGVTLETLASYAVTDAGTDLASFSAISLLLNADTGLRYFFTLDESVTDFTVTYDGEELPVTKRGGMHYVTVASVAAQDLDKKFVVTINDGTESVEVSATALSYCYNVLKSGDASSEDLHNLVKALYLYNQAANAYFDNRG